MIKSAQLRSTISDIEKLNTSVYTFKFEYNGIPGDLKRSDAIQLGFFYVTSYNPASPGYGDGNGLIQSPFGVVGTANYGHFWGEAPMFFRHLSDSRLTEGSYGSALLIDSKMAANVTTASEAAAYMPRTDAGSNSIITVQSHAGINYYLLSSLKSISAGNGQYDTPGVNSLKPSEAHQIDSKIDDGKANTGTIWGFSGTSGDMTYSTTWKDGTAQGSCHSAGTYSVSNDTVQCSLALRFR